MGNYGRYIKKHLFGITLGTVGVIGEAMCDIWQPTLMAKVINQGVTSGSLASVLHLSAIMLLIALLGAVFACTRNLTSSVVSQKFGGEVRRDLFDKVQHLPVEALDAIGSGSIVNRLTNDVNQLTELVNKTMRMSVKAPVVCIGSIVMSCFLSGWLAGVFLCATLGAFLLIYLCMSLGYRKFYKVQKAIDRIATVMEEYLGGVRLVKSFGRFQYEEERFEQANDRLFNLSVSAQRILAVLSPFISLSIYYGMAAVLYVGSIQAHAGQLGVGSIVALISYMLLMLTSLTSISNAINTFARTRASVERISELLDQKNEFEGGSTPAAEKSAGISFEDVVFSYPGAAGDPVLRGLTFSCGAGQTLAIIGATGAGKTTIVSLLLGFYNNYSGTIEIGGQDIRSMSRKALRRSIGVAPQRSMLFSGSIENNLRWGRESAAGQEIRSAAKTAQAEEFILSRPDGYDSELTQGATNLSGGQKQRLSIARALVKQPRVLLFDDATGALDALTETRVLSALREQQRNTTQIIITQRISVARAADCILVLENGEAAGVGSHEQLFADCQPYRDICASQYGKQGVNQHA